MTTAEIKAMATEYIMNTYGERFSGVRPWRRGLSMGCGWEKIPRFSGRFSRQRVGALPS